MYSLSTYLVYLLGLVDPTVWEITCRSTQQFLDKVGPELTRFAIFVSLSRVV